MKISWKQKGLSIVAGILAVGFLSPTFAQSPTSKLANIWYFGDKAGLDFTNGHPSAITNSAMQSFEGSAVANDRNGRLLFYTNGGSLPFQGAVWNKNHQMMPNGNLNGAGGCNSALQSSLILPLPQNSSRYYLFTTDCMENNAAGGLRYNIIDLNLDGGLGDIAVKAKKLTESIDESLTAIQHDNGVDWWIVAHKLNSDSFYVYQFTAQGITGVVKQKIGNVTPDYAGALIAPSSGNKLVHTGLSFTTLFDFDKSTGLISNAVDLGVPGYTSAFSTNCDKLYVGDGTGGHIFQFDLKSQDIPASKLLVGTTASAGVGAMQLGPDGKIYVARFVGSTHLGVIHEPSLKGTRSQYVDNGISLNGKMAKGGLPNFPNTYTGNCASTLPVRNFDNLQNANKIKVKLEGLIANGATIRWDGREDAFYSVQFRQKGNNEWNAVEVEGNSFFLENVNLNNEYEVMVNPKDENIVSQFIRLSDHLIADLLPADSQNETPLAEKTKSFQTIRFDFNKTIGWDEMK